MGFRFCWIGYRIKTTIVSVKKRTQKLQEEQMVTKDLQSKMGTVSEQKIIILPQKNQSWDDDGSFSHGRILLGV
jgi:hypothetical protein